MELNPNRTVKADRITFQTGEKDVFAISVIKFLISLRIIINVHTAEAGIGRYYAGKSL
jgi:hypothetical protein